MDNNLALIIQGPFNKKAYLYYSKFTYVTIIFSTWVDEVIDLELNSKNHYIVKSEKPSISGPYNLNFQIESSINGVRKIQDLEEKLKINFFCIKIRSDFIFTNFNFYSTNIKFQKNTIYTTSLYSYTYKTYFSDYIFCGWTESLIRFLNINLEPKIYDEFNIPERVLFSNWTGNISTLPDLSPKKQSLFWLKYKVVPTNREIKLIQPMNSLRTKSIKRILFYIINKIDRKISN
jgi:hypothetical protein